MKNNEKAIKRLLRPPSVANWVRHNHRRLDDTQRGLERFIASPPRHSLSEIYKICEAIVTHSISLEQAQTCIEKIPQPIARRAAREVIPAFYAYAAEQHLDGIATFKDFRAPYPIGRAPDGKTLTVPVVPTFTLIREEKLVPVFMIAWSSLGLDPYQKQLLSTIIKNAILTQQDFMNSDALVICTPRYKSTETRLVKTWNVRDYAVLSDEDLQEQFARYNQALQEVIRTLSGE